ncbi:MAG: hypothetical protein ACRC11_08380 [Xenococcaceae cyanobacterium]
MSELFIGKARQFGGYLRIALARRRQFNPTASDGWGILFDILLKSKFDRIN